MITEGNKFRAELLKIVGLSLTTPAGKLVLSIPDVEFWKLTWNLILFIAISFILLYCAIIVLSRALYMIDREKHSI